MAQFNNKITIKIVSSLDEFGEEASASEYQINCKVLEQVKSRDVSDDRRKKNAYDMKIIVSSRTYTPYKELFEDETLKFAYDGLTYEPITIAQINNFSGKPKYYEITLKQVAA